MSRGRGISYNAIRRSTGKHSQQVIHGRRSDKNNIMKGFVEKTLFLREMDGWMSSPTSKDAGGEGEVSLA